MNRMICSAPVRTAAVVVMAALALAMPRPAAAATYNVATVPALQAAISIAVAGDIIQLAPGIYPITSTLTIGLGQDVTIQGDPNMATVIDGGGNNLLTLLLVNANYVAIENLTLQNAGTGIEWEGNGGFSSRFSVAGVTITGTAGHGFYTQSGGRVYFINSTIANNAGIGIESESISNPFLFSISLTNVTVSNNVREGIYSNTYVPWSAANSLIVANKLDCSLPPAALDPEYAMWGPPLKVATLIDSDTSCVTAATPLPFPPLFPVGVVSTVAFPALGLDPNLGANGGPTLTEAIASPSPAVGAGEQHWCQPTDQRGAVRKTNCDLGAYEYLAVPPDNTPIGSPVALSPVGGGPFSKVSVTFTTVSGAGNTTATIGGPAPPSGFKVDGVVYDISTTAAFTPPATVCLPYDPVIDPNPKLYHYEKVNPPLGWQDITTSVDTVNHVVCGDTSTFSPFGVLFTTVPTTVPFASFTARVEIERAHRPSIKGEDSFEVEGRGVLGPASNGIAPSTEDVTLSLGSFSLTIPKGSFVEKSDKDDDHDKGDHDKKDMDDRITTYQFKGVVAGVSLTAEIEQGPKHTFRFQFDGRHASLGLVTKPAVITVGLAIGDDTGQVTVKADVDK